MIDLKMTVKVSQKVEETTDHFSDDFADTKTQIEIIVANQHDDVSKKLSTFTHKTVF